jgi:hypothetical protein
MRLAFLLFVCGVSIALPSKAQTPAATSQLSHDEVISRVTGLMYVHSMTKRCPLPKNIADTFETVAMVLASAMPTISQDETAVAAKNAEARADRNIETSKEKSCKEAQQIIETTADALSKLKRRPQ